MLQFPVDLDTDLVLVVRQVKAKVIQDPIVLIDGEQVSGPGVVMDLQVTLQVMMNVFDQRCSGLCAGIQMELINVVLEVCRYFFDQRKSYR